MGATEDTPWRRVIAGRRPADISWRGTELPEAAEPLVEQPEKSWRVDVHGDVGVRLPPGPAPQVDVRPPARELAAAVDDHAAVESPEQVPADDVADRDRVVDGRAREVVGLDVELVVEVEELGHELPHAARRAELLGVGRRDQG